MSSPEGTSAATGLGSSIAGARRASAANGIAVTAQSTSARAICFHRFIVSPSRLMAADAIHLPTPALYAGRARIAVNCFTLLPSPPPASENQGMDSNGTVPQPAADSSAPPQVAAPI